MTARSPRAVTDGRLQGAVALAPSLCLSVNFYTSSKAASEITTFLDISENLSSEQRGGDSHWGPCSRLDRSP